ncbi:MAG: hypothetical protein JWN08_3631 [Frankiales bacterium]|nr:hypothetical protein [Frankiales bacterium]
MASLPECEQALESLAERLADVPAHVRGKYVVSRTLACRVPDLDVVFLARLGDDGLEELRYEPGSGTAGAQVRLAAQSDDLLALIAGELSPPAAWATGRLKVEASVLDLLKLRTLL